VSGLSNATVCVALTLSLVPCLPAILPIARCRYREMADPLISYHLIELDVRTVILDDLVNSPSSIKRIIDGTSISMTSIGTVAHVLLRRHFAQVSTLTGRAPFTLRLDGRLMPSTRRLSVR
jgi:hypothetical protein